VHGHVDELDGVADELGDRLGSTTTTSFAPASTAEL
jgi:hypothetical protein